MRIALVNSLFPPLGIGGSELSTYYLAKGLLQAGHDVQVFSENTTNELVETEYRGVPVMRFPAPPGHGPNVLARPRLEQELRRVTMPPVDALADRMRAQILKFAPDILHTAVLGNLTNFWTMARNHSLTSVHTARSYTMLCSRRMLRGDQPCARQCLACLTDSRRRARDASSVLDGIVTISRHVMDVYSGAGWFADVANRAVIANSYEPTLTEVPDKTDAYDFGYIGRIHETKGVEELLNAFTAVAERSERKLRLLVAGSGNPEYVADLAERHASETIRFAGYLDTARFFEQVRFCVVPSVWYEPFGRVFAETFHHATPVLGSVRGGGAETIGKDTGWLFDPGDGADLERAMEEACRLSDDDYADMAARCLAEAGKYSVSAIASQYESFYRQCLDAKR